MEWLKQCLDAEVLTYENSFLLIKDDETWSEDEFLSLEKPVNVIVDGQLTLDDDVTAEALMEKIASIDILGEVIVHEKKLKRSLRNLERVNSGRIVEADKLESRNKVMLKNMGALSL